MNQQAKLPLLKIDLEDVQGSKEKEISNEAELSPQNNLNHLGNSINGEFSRANIIKMLSSVILYNGYGWLKSISQHDMA